MLHNQVIVDTHELSKDDFKMELIVSIGCAKQGYKMMDVTQDKLISGEYVFHISNTSTTKLTVTGVSSSNPLHKKFAISPDSRSIEPGEMLSVIVGWMYPTPDFPTPPGTITLMTEERGEISRAIPL